MSGDSNFPAAHVVVIPVPSANVQLEAVVVMQGTRPAVVAQVADANEKQHMSLPIIRRRARPCEAFACVGGA